MGVGPAPGFAPQTPRGTRDFLPAEAGRKRELEGLLRAEFEAWGYREILTPAVELADVLAAGDGPGFQERLYRFFDREGNTLALRPEMTTPIARVAATRLRNESLPLRLYYVTNVFRYEEPQAGRQREFWQAGTELLGGAGPAADAEAVALAVACARRAGLARFRLDVGQVEFLHGVMEALDVAPPLRASLREALVRRDYVAMDRLLADSSLSRGERELFSEMRKLRGGPEVLERARRLAPGPRARAALDDLATICELAAAYGAGDRIGVDLGLLKDLTYYTGMVLEGYSEDFGLPLCTGGRYDQLLGRFGYPCPATGFVFGVERMLLARGPGAAEQGGAARLWLVGTAAQGDLPAAIGLIRAVRGAGWPAELDPEPWGDPARYGPVRARVRNASYVAWAGPGEEGGWQPADSPGKGRRGPLAWVLAALPRP